MHRVVLIWGFTRNEAEISLRIRRKQNWGDHTTRIIKRTHFTHEEILANRTSNRVPMTKPKNLAKDYPYKGFQDGLGSKNEGKGRAKKGDTVQGREFHF